MEIQIWCSLYWQHHSIFQTLLPSQFLVSGNCSISPSQDWGHLQILPSFTHRYNASPVIYIYLILSKCIYFFPFPLFTVGQLDSTLHLTNKCTANFPIASFPNPLSTSQPTSTATVSLELLPHYLWERWLCVKWLIIPFSFRNLNFYV